MPTKCIQVGLGAVVLVGLGLGAAACGSSTLQGGTYTAPSQSGQPVMVRLPAGGTGKGSLAWHAGGTGSLPVNAVLQGNSITLNLGLGLKITGTVRASNAFQLTYAQNKQGEPELGDPSRTLDFRLSHGSQ